MSTVDDHREGCDGCNRSVSLEELTAVTMPDGETIACCPRCEPHARRAAENVTSIEQHRAACDGCADRVIDDRLTDAVLPDGAVVTVCPSCLSDVPGRDGRTDERSAGTDRSDASADDTADRNRCSQCREWVREELYEVTMIDGRAERLCTPCKSYAQEDGTVDAVKMRHSRARAVLGVTDDASATEIQRAFRDQVKRAHPDRNTGSRSAFSLVVEAYERLQ